MDHHLITLTPMDFVVMWVTIIIYLCVGLALGYYEGTKQRQKEMAKLHVLIYSRALLDLPVPNHQLITENPVVRVALLSPNAAVPTS